ncbi:TerC/Alx family metal homeostasis membrane protein [Kribbella solani]|uniref:TerC/Alx family metal homeostasis membrane protein n=1 Tax=Kribbella solani TaxID=236067 RepID=UPI0029A1BAD4|nr:TerC/Alx family metal homeostasis membrane protein [Kribbella solani]MDX3000886.1 TerC/Alx family metal homeostasis membrane protein [Kribbella solani]
MTVSPLVWVLTLLAIVGLLLFDYFFHVRSAHVPTLREAAVWSALYVGIAVLFGLGTLIVGGGAMGSEYFAGYVTEKALSVDNLFVFLIIMTSFRVPRENQQKVLLVGIVVSLFARSAFIFVGSALLNTFSWVFYLFGLALLLTAGNMLRPETEESHSAQNLVVRLARRVFRTTEEYAGDRLTTVVDGRRMLTPMLLVMVAIGGTDLMFALDSIPAIFGLTQNVYVVFTATAFSLLGLRQLFFLLDGLLDRLIYLSFGLAAILAFIGAKLILHALHENNLPFVNGGDPVDVLEISTGFSLLVILVVLLLTIFASLFSTRGRTQTAMAHIRRDATAYLDPEYTDDPAERERIFQRLLRARDHITTLGPKAKQQVRNEADLMALCRQVANAHSTAHPTHKIHPNL